MIYFEFAFKMHELFYRGLMTLRVHSHFRYQSLTLPPPSMPDLRSFSVLSHIKHCLGLFLHHTPSVRPDVTGLPTHKPLLCISRASFIPRLSCPPTTFVDSNLDWPSIGPCRAQANTGRGNRRVSVEEAACHHVLKMQEAACYAIIHRIRFLTRRLSIHSCSFMHLRIIFHI